jgi:hypothetical protein
LVARARRRAESGDHDIAAQQEIISALKRKGLPSKKSRAILGKLIRRKPPRWRKWKLAYEYLAYIGEHSTYGNGALLTSIVRGMIDRAKAGQKWSGVHVGFLAGVNRHAMAIAHALRVDRG